MHSSRHVVLLWCLWLLGSWGVALWRYDLTQASQLMMLAVLLGLLLIWPLYRLSESVGPGRPGVSSKVPDSDGYLQTYVLVDWVSLLIVSQAVFWPLQVVNDWPRYQTQWLNLSLVAWSLMAALFVAWGCGRRSAWSRGVAMALCIALAGGAGFWAVLMWWMGIHALPVDALSYGPLTGIWVMSHSPTWAQQQVWMSQTVLVGSVGLMGWTGLSMIRLSLRQAELGKSTGTVD